MVLMANILEDVLGGAPVARREWLIKRAEEERIWRGYAVRSNFGQLALDLQTEAVEVKIIRIVVEGVLAALGNEYK